MAKSKKQKHAICSQTKKEQWNQRALWLRRFSILGLALCLMVWVAIEVSDPNTLPIEYAHIEANLVYLDQADLKPIITPFLNQGFFVVDVDELQDQIAMLPWVEKASVRRVWPNRLMIRIKEQQAVAQWGEQGLLNSEGELFSPERDDFPAGLPRLAGPDGQSQQVLSTFYWANEQLRTIGLKANTLLLTPRRAWEAQLDNGITLFFGRSDFKPRLKRFISAYNQTIGPNGTEVAYVDLRYTNGMAVK